MYRAIALFASLFVFTACGGDESLESRAKSAADKLCACKTQECMDKAATTMDKLDKEWKKAGEKQGKISEYMNRADDCRRAGPGAGGGGGASKAAKKAVAKVQAVVDEACGCDSPECKQAAMKKLGDVAKLLDDKGAFSADEQKMIGELFDKAAKCAK